MHVHGLALGRERAVEAGDDVNVCVAAAGRSLHGGQIGETNALAFEIKICRR
jgi:hypothetical protein